MSESENPQAGSEVPLEHAKELGEALAHIEVLRAAHETLALGVTGSNEAINALGVRMDAIVQSQAQAAEDLVKLKPIAAAVAEEEGIEGVVTGEVAPDAVANTAEKEKDNPLTGFHRIFG